MTIHRVSFPRRWHGFLLCALCAIGALILLPQWSAAQTPYLVKDISGATDFCRMQAEGFQGHRRMVLLR